MQHFSFDFGDPVFDLAGWRVSLQTTTLENTYGVDPERTRHDGLSVTSSGLTWAGGQQRAAGSASVVASPARDGLEIAASAEHGSEHIRSLKLTITGIPPGELLGNNWEPRPVPPRGVVLRYPLFLHAPLVFLQHSGGAYTYLHALDPEIRAKRIAIYPEGNALTADLIHEEAAHKFGRRIDAPPWRIGRCDDPAKIVEDHARHLETSTGILPWEQRSDVPAWAREIALVVALHGMHWTGYKFNTYADMLRALKWVCQRIDGRRVLAFLPGWEGRYYWQYGDYRPAPDLGGPDGFRALCDGAISLGVTIMPMFGANCANVAAPGFETWGEPSRLRSPSGLEFQGNRPDWDASRSNDPGWQAWLNPGAVHWRDRLRTQVLSVLKEYGLRAVFFDTHHIWENDPQGPVYDGLRTLFGGLRDALPDLLIAGEGWYDALGALTPVSQVGAPARWPQVFSKYCRTFAHLMWGDPSRDSSGVHEAGHVPFRLVPDEPHWWPSLTVVDGTIERAPELCEQVIAQGRAYAEKYLSR